VRPFDAAWWWTIDPANSLFTRAGAVPAADMLKQLGWN
jgi:hypothetical protein